MNRAIYGRTARRSLVWSSVAFCAALAACSKDSTSPIQAGSLQIVSGDAQTGTVGSVLAQALVVKVTDSSGNALANVEVLWDTGSGSLDVAATATDANGMAQAVWTLGTTAGTANATASVSGVPIANFTATATAGPPASMAIVSGDSTSAAVGTLIPDPLVVRVMDQYSNPVPGIIVMFASSAGDTFSVESLATDAAGEASVSVTLSGTAGWRTITASVPDVSSVTFDLDGSASAAARGRIVRQP